MSDRVFQMHFDDEEVIRTVCTPVEDPASPEMKALLTEMVEYLKNSQDDRWAKRHHVRAGVGLAAPQIGIPQRFFAVYVVTGGKELKYGLINPVVVRQSVKQAALENGEGCLSVADDRDGYVRRSFRITVRAYDALVGQEVEITQKGYPAIIFQHELDHLDGHLYYDRIDALDPWREDPETVLI